MAATSISGDAYEVDYSCRFNYGDSSKLTRQQASGTGKKQTIGGWFKIASAFISTRLLIDAGSGSAPEGWLSVWLDVNEQMRVSLINEAGATRIDTYINMVFRDPHAWYHLCITWDTTPVTPIFKIFINNVEQTLAGANTIAQNDEFGLNANTGDITLCSSEGGPNYFDGYLSQWFCLDGTTVTTPAAGGIVEVDNNGIVRAADLTSLDFDAQGWLLDFVDSNDLGNDVSGNNHDFTSSGLATNDQVVDTPTNNFCNISPIALYNATNSSMDLSYGNLDTDNTQAAYDANRGSIQLPAEGKWAFQFTVDGSSSGTNDGQVGFQHNPEAVSALNSTGTPGAFIEFNSGAIYKDGVKQEDAGALTDNDVVELLLDIDNGTFDVKLNDSAHGSQVTGLTTTTYQVGMRCYDIGAKFDFGQLSYTPSDSDYKTICTNNLPAPTIVDPSSHFQPNTRTGDGSAGAVTQTGNSQFGTDLIIIKNRDQEDDEWKVVDSVRGATYEINTDSTNAQTQDTNGVTAFSATDGYTIGSGAGGYNDNTEKFIDYHFQEGSTPGMGINASVSHTQGSETTIAHGMSAVPVFALLKETDAATAWWVYHQNLTSKTDNYLVLDTDAGIPTAIPAVWGTQSSTNFVIGDAASGVATGTYVCYSFAEISGFSSFGKYEGTGVTNGTSVITGFKPALVICKSIDSTSNWFCYDSEREGYNVDNDSLYMDTVDDENTADEIDLLSNGFKLRIATDPNVEETYIYAAWAENPFGGHGGTFGDGVSPATAR